jgi:hypothetical protein
MPRAGRKVEPRTAKDGPVARLGDVAGRVYRPQTPVRGCSRLNAGSSSASRLRFAPVDDACDPDDVSGDGWGEDNVPEGSWLTLLHVVRSKSCPAPEVASLRGSYRPQVCGGSTTGAP